MAENIDKPMFCMNTQIFVAQNVSESVQHIVNILLHKIINMLVSIIAALNASVDIFYVWFYVCVRQYAAWYGTLSCSKQLFNRFYFIGVYKVGLSEAWLHAH